MYIYVVLPIREFASIIYDGPLNIHIIYIAHINVSEASCIVWKEMLRVALVVVGYALTKTIVYFPSLI